MPNHINPAHWDWNNVSVTRMAAAWGCAWIGHRSRTFGASLLLYLLVGLLAGCAMVPLPTRSGRTQETGALGACAVFFAELDDRVEKAGVIDAGAFRVPGYPYLRVNRFLASFSSDVGDEAAFAAWTNRMQALDREARNYEIANLPDATIAGLAPDLGRSGLLAEVDSCGDLLRAADFQDVSRHTALRQRVLATDDYIELRRVVGLYPLTGLFVSSGVSRWQAEARERFSPAPPVDWQTIRYLPADKSDPAAARRIVASAEKDGLGIPVYAPADLHRLFQIYAPVWEIRLTGAYDHIGTPVRTGSGDLELDAGRAVTYTLLSFTRFGGEIRTQLNYIIWFPARPRRHALDMYGGKFDGIDYRVTLDGDGRPLIYETMHNCGCYYKAYPTAGLQARRSFELCRTAPDTDGTPNESG